VAEIAKSSRVLSDVTDDRTCVNEGDDHIMMIMMMMI